MIFILTGQTRVFQLTYKTFLEGHHYLQLKTKFSDTINSTCVYCISVESQKLVPGTEGNQTTTFIESSFNIGEGNGNPLQYSCLENPMDEGA